MHGLQVNVRTYAGSSRFGRSPGEAFSPAEGDVAAVDSNLRLKGVSLNG